LRQGLQVGVMSFNLFNLVLEALVEELLVLDDVEVHVLVGPDLVLDLSLLGPLLLSGLGGAT